MYHDEAKTIIRDILDTDISFDGHFDRCFDNIKGEQQDQIIRWVKDCRDHLVNPIQSKNNREIIGFVKRIGSNLRAIWIKEKKGYFIELFLDKHKYYEAEMERFGF